MTEPSKTSDDRRIRRTRSLVFNAFAELVVTVRYDELTTRQVIDRAGIGRSTFYDHFADKNDVLAQSLAGPLSVLAAALTGKSDSDEAVGILHHFWDRRTLMRVILQHPTRSIVEKALKQQLLLLFDHQSFDQDLLAKATYCTSGFLALLEDWVTGQISFSAEEMNALINKLAHLWID